MPPSEWPQAMVWVGVPTRWSKALRVRIWSGSASEMSQPALAYDEPASA